jgi:hypothetical protein
MAKSKSVQQLEMELDVRLLTVWQKIDDEDQLDLGYVSTLLRAAYGQGYVDALTEPVRGQLCIDLGFEIPPRRRR